MQAKTMMTVYLRSSIAALCLVLSFSLTAASSKDKPASIKGQDSRAVLNTIHSDELRSIMRRLDALAYEREYTALALQRMRAARISELVEMVGELVNRTEDLPSITPQIVSEEDRVTFRALAKHLQSQTIDLKNQIEKDNYADMDATYDELRRTCDSCHRLFRN